MRSARPAASPLRSERRAFADDKNDAGELGAGHTATEIYEIVPAEVAVVAADTVLLKYQSERAPTAAATEGAELATVKLHCKAPTADESKLLSSPIASTPVTQAETSDAFRFSAPVAGFGMMLQSSKHTGHGDVP